MAPTCCGKLAMVQFETDKQAACKHLQAACVFLIIAIL